MNSINSPGCVILLIDESAGMKTIMRDKVADGKESNKTNAERVATAINSLLAQLSAASDFDLALVGYRTDAAGQTDVGCRWGGALAGREFVSSAELGRSPIREESRTRRVPLPGGAFREEAVNFPIWHEPALGAKAPQIAAYDFCRELLSRWNAGPAPGQPLLLHVFSGSSGDGNPQMAVAKLLETQTPGGTPLVFQVHLAASGAMTPTLYPANQAYLTVGGARDLFRRSSVLPETLVASLREAKVVVNKGARGMLYNAKIGDLIRCLGLIKTVAKSWPARSAPEPYAPAPYSPAPTAPAIPPAPVAPVASDAAVFPASDPGFSPAPDLSDATMPFDSMPIEAAESGPGAFDGAPPATAGERIGLAVLLLDRSVDDPYSGGLDSCCARLQDQANDLLKQLGKLGELPIDVAIVSYGSDGAGQCEAREQFDGPLAGQTTVRNTQLPDGALRIDEFEEEVSNGIGGLVQMTRKKPIYFDLEPTFPVSPHEGFAAASRIVGAWLAEHPSARLAPIVLHLTGGRCDTTDYEQAAAVLGAQSGLAGPVTLYHLVLTQSPFASLAYPENDADLKDTPLERLWAASSPLLDCDKLAAERPGIAAGARGFVVNGKFDLLVDAFRRGLTSDTADEQLAGI